MIFSFLYRYLIYPALLSIFRLLALFNPKIKTALELRQNQNSKPPWLLTSLSQRPVWIHCASGEFEYAKPVINAIKLKYPQIKILITYFSPSVVESLEKYKNIDFFCPLPWDQPHALKEFLNHHSPRALLIARTDAWPEMLTQTKLLKIPSLMFSSTLSPSSSRMSWVARSFTAWTLGNLSEIQCVSQDDFTCFKQLGLGHLTKVCGDTRYDQVIERLKHPKPIKDFLFRHAPNEKIFVAGSTWPEDEEVLLDIIAFSFRKKLKMKFVLVPHEPTSQHMSELKQKASAKGLEIEFYSELNQWSANKILVVDQVGILAEIYAYASLAFVGGSFRKTVHSVMEPLAAGCLTFVGPKHLNNREALFMKKISLKSFSDLSPVIEVKKLKDFQNYVQDLDDREFSSVSLEIKNLISQRAGEATEKVMQWLSPYLD